MNAGRLFLTLGAAGAALLTSHATMASDSGLVVELANDGYIQQPVVLSLTAAASSPAEELVRGCPGFLPDEEHAIDFELKTAQPALNFYLDSAQAVATVLRGPNGIYHCAPSEAGNPAHQQFTDAQPGSYRLWPAFESAGESHGLRILASGDPLSPRQIRPLDPAELVPARQGEVAFEPPADAERQALASAPVQASEPANSVGGYCSGHVDFSAADVTLVLDETVSALSIYAESETDLVLMVLKPDGTWECNDDANGVNPGLTIASAPAGDYQILVGAFQQNAGGTYELFANEGAPAWTNPDPWDNSWSGSVDLAYAAEPAAGRLALTADKDEARVQVDLVSGGTPADQVDWSCQGQIDFTRPDAILSMDAGEELITIYGVSSEDTTLLVRTPDGSILCNDDYQGLNPGIEISAPQPGDYAIWLGSYHGFGGEATLAATRAAPVWVQDRRAELPLQQRPRIERATLEAELPAEVVQVIGALAQLTGGDTSFVLGELPEVTPRGQGWEVYFPDLATNYVFFQDWLDLSETVALIEPREGDRLGVEVLVPSRLSALREEEDGDFPIATIEMGRTQLTGEVYGPAGSFILLDARADNLALVPSDAAIARGLVLPIGEQTRIDNLRLHTDLEPDEAGLWSGDGGVELLGLELRAEGVPMLRLESAYLHSDMADADLVALSLFSREIEEVYLEDPAAELPTARFLEMLETFRDTSASLGLEGLSLAIDRSGLDARGEDFESLEIARMETRFVLSEMNGAAPGLGWSYLHEGLVRQLGAEGSEPGELEDLRLELTLANLPAIASWRGIADSLEYDPSLALTLLGESGSSIMLSSQGDGSLGSLVAEGSLSALPQAALGFVGGFTLGLSDYRPAQNSIFADLIDDEMIEIFESLAAEREDGSRRLEISLEEDGEVLVNGKPADDALR